MKYNKLGKSDLHISVIGFGCMSLPENESQAIEILHAAAEQGINYFDTADVYDKGNNERVLGKAFRSTRDKIIIASKVGNVARNDGKPGFIWDPSKKNILETVENSLKRLNTDYIDLYQLHGGTMEDNIDETIEAFELLKQQGKIKYYGISSIRPAVIQEYAHRSNISSVMLQYSLLDRRPEEGTLDLLHQHSISVLVRGALAQGLLAGKTARQYLTYSKEEVENISASINHSSHAAMNYVLKHPAVASAVIGIRTREQLTDIISGL